MEQITTRHLDSLYCLLSEDKLSLYELPPAVALFYYLGEAHGEARLRSELRQALADRDRYYSHASRGGFSTPLKAQGKTFAELSRIRGDNAQAERAENREKSLTFNVRVTA